MKNKIHLDMMITKTEIQYYLESIILILKIVKTFLKKYVINIS